MSDSRQTAERLAELVVERYLPPPHPVNVKTSMWTEQDEKHRQRKVTDLLDGLGTAAGDVLAGRRIDRDDLVRYGMAQRMLHDVNNPRAPFDVLVDAGVLAADQLDQALALEATCARV